jgi:DNA-binding PadR family transcriptional regulator
MSRSAVTPVVLGMLWHGPLSGYDIKRAVERSTAFFWRASYGQLYPELKRLAADGLVSATDGSSGDRPRRVYALTEPGRSALAAWLREERTTVQLRDENLLRLFFADALPRAQALGVLRDRRDGHAERLAVLQQIAKGAGADPDFAALPLRWGLAFHEWGRRWCDDELQRLTP